MAFLACLWGLAAAGEVTPEAVMTLPHALAV
jgi:hypothetical protein